MNLGTIPVHGAGIAVPSGVKGTIYAFGYNGYGEVGDSTCSNDPSPFTTTVTNATAVAAGYYHSLVLTTLTTVQAFGSDLYGELGNSSSNNGCNNKPTTVVGPIGSPTLKPVRAIAAGDAFSIAVVTKTASPYTSIVYAWGYNGYGDLANGSTDSSAHSIPQPVATGVLTNVVSIAVGGDTVLALTADGRVFSWGYDLYGQCGTGAIVPSPYDLTTPQIIPYLPKIVAIAAGQQHGMALSSTGQVFAWGDDSRGQLGDGVTNPLNYSYAAPTVVEFSTGKPMTGIAAIGAGGYNGFAVSTTGLLYSWGDNTYGQLGQNTTGGFSNTPHTVVGTGGTGALSSVTAVAAGSYHALAIRTGGKLVSWGLNNYGQLGQGNYANSSVPLTVTLPGGKHAGAIAAGGYVNNSTGHSLVIGS